MPYDFYNEEKKEFQPTGGGASTESLNRPWGGIAYPRATASPDLCVTFCLLIGLGHGVGFRKASVIKDHV